MTPQLKSKRTADQTFFDECAADPRDQFAELDKPEDIVRDVLRAHMVPPTDELVRDIIRWHDDDGHGNERAVRVIREAFAFVLQSPSGIATRAMGLAWVAGCPPSWGATQTEAALALDVTRAALSKHATLACDIFGVKPVGTMKSLSARQSYRHAMIAWHKRRKHQETKAR